MVGEGTGWRTWLLTDRRFVDGRPDVLTYGTAPLTEPVKLAGEPIVYLMASTSGTDSAQQYGLSLHVIVQALPISHWMVWLVKSPEQLKKRCRFYLPNSQRCESTF